MEFKDEKIAIMIPTYKLRKSAIDLFNILNEFDDKYDCFIVTQENDPKKDEVFKYKNDKIQILSPDVMSIFQKRYFILEYAKEHKYKYLVQIDDDIKLYLQCIKEGEKRKSGFNKVFIKGLYIVDYIEILLENIKKYNAGMIGCPPAGNLSFANKIDTIQKFAQCTNCMMMDVEKAFYANIYYDKSGELNEDADICIKYLQEGFYCIRLGWMAFDQYGNWISGDKSVIYKNQKDLYHLVFGTVLKYHITPVFSKGRVTFPPKLQLYFNTYKLPKLDDVYKKFYENEDLEGLLNYLKNKRKEKEKNNKIKQINNYIIKNKNKKNEI